MAFNFYFLPEDKEYNQTQIIQSFQFDEGSFPWRQSVQTVETIVGLRIVK